MAGGSLSPIYNNLNGVDPYHPFEADTYADWSLEAGDIVTVSRDGTSYSSPVHSASLVWRGQPEMHISSTGKEKRDPISRVSMKKYASRGGGMWNNQSLYWELYSDDGQFHSVLEATSSRLSARMEDFYNGLYSYIEFTASRLYTEFVGLYDGLSSHFEITRSRMYADFMGLYDGLSSQFEVTRSRMYVDFMGLYDGLSSTFEVTRSRMYADFYGLYDGLSSTFEVTRSRMYADFMGLYDGLSSTFEVTRSRMYADFQGMYDGLSSSFEVTRSRMYVDFQGMYDGLSSTFEVTRSRMYVDFHGMYDGLSSTFEVTRSRMYVAFQGMYDGLSSTFEVTRSRMYVDFTGLYDGLNSSFEVTRSRMRAEFAGLYDGLKSSFEVTRSRMYVDFHGMYDGLSSTFEVTRSRMYVAFNDAYNGLSSEFIRTASSWTSQFNNTYTNLSSRINQEANRIGLVVEGTGTNAHIKPAEIVAAINEAGESIANISADKILLDGSTKLSGALTIVDGRLFTNKDIQAPNIALSSGGHVRFIGTATGEYYDLSASDVDEMLVDAEVDPNTNTLKIWKKGDPAANPSITFSKAASVTALTGSWSGGTLTVATVPASGHTFVNTPSLALNGNGTDSFSAEMSASDSSGSTAVRSSIYGYLKLTGSGTGSSVTVSKNSDGTGVVASKSVGSVYTAGQNSVNVVKGSWSGGRIAFTPSAGTGETKTVELSQGSTTWSSNTASVPVTDGSTTAYTVSVDASSRYTAGQNDVTINKGDWSSGQISFTKSAGTASTKSVQLTAANATWSGTVASRVIWDGTAADAQHGVSTGYTVSVDASSKLTTKSISANGTYTPDSGYIGFSSVNVDVPSSTGTVTTAWEQDNPQSASNPYNKFHVYLNGVHNTAEVIGVGMTYNSTTHKYTSTVSATSRSVVNTVTSGTEAFGDGWSDGYDTAYGYFSLPATKTSSNVTDTFVVGGPKSDGSGSASYTFSMTKGSTPGATGYASVTLNGNLKARISIGDWYSSGETAVLNAFANGFGTTAPSGASNSGYTNNNSGYQILSTGSSGEAVIVVRGAFNYSGLSRYAYNYLYAAPTALYRKGYSDGQSAGSHSVENFGTTAPGGATYGSYTNNSDGYSVSGSGNSATAVIVVRADWTCGGTSQNGTSYLSYAPTALYRAAYSAGYTAGGGGGGSTINNARSRFGSASTGYYIEAYDSTTGNSVSGSSVNYQIKGIYDSSRGGGYIQIHDKSSPSARIANTHETNVWLVTANQKNHQGTLAYDTVYGITVGNDIIATWKTPEATSHSISVSKQWSSGGSSYSTGGKLNGGGVSKSGLSANTYCYIRVKCGATEKEIYFPINA